MTKEKKDNKEIYESILKKIRYERQMKKKRLYEQAKRANKKNKDNGV